MRLIDADVFEAIGGHVPEGYDAESYTAGQTDILERIDTLPTVDAVEVTRCKQCVFCRTASIHNSKKKVWLCNRKFETFQVKPESFCSFAQKQGAVSKKHLILCDDCKFFDDRNADKMTFRGICSLWNRTTSWHDYCSKAQKEENHG